VIVVDFYNRLVLKRLEQGASQGDDRAQVYVSRVATLMIGVIAIALSCLVGRLGDLIEIANKVIQLFTGPLFGIYLLGMFTRRARSGGVLAGGVMGTVMSVYIAFFSNLSFVWPTVFGLAATLTVGYGLALLVRGGDDYIPLTWRDVMREPETAQAVAEPVGQ
jgi:Na+/proline symporter